MGNCENIQISGNFGIPRQFFHLQKQLFKADMKNSSKFVRPEFYRVHYQRETRTQVLSEDTTMLLHPFTGQIFDKMSFYHSNSCHLWNVSLYSNNSCFRLKRLYLFTNWYLAGCHMAYSGGSGFFRAHIFYLQNICHC